MSEVIRDPGGLFHEIVLLETGPYPWWATTRCGIKVTVLAGITNLRIRKENALVTCIQCLGWREDDTKQVLEDYARVDSYDPRDV